MRISNYTATAKFARYRLGSIEIPASGEYRIEASGTLDPKSHRAEVLID